MFKTYSMELAGRTLTVETGKLAELANANVLVRYGETVVMVNVTASKEPKEGIDFFPLSVDYEEKMYSVGKIPGGFTRREGKAADKAILVSRAIDRPIRPLFPKDFRNDVCVVATVLSVEQDNSPEVAAMIGASAALSISCQLTTGPLAYICFGTFPKYFLLSNLIALPLTGAIIPISILTVAMYTAGICPGILIRITEAAVQVMCRSLDIISGM